MSVDLLLNHFSTRKRTRNHYVVLMKLLENSFFKDKFPNNLSIFLHDKEAKIDFGESDTIFNNPKISWVVKNHTDFVATAPNIK